MSERELSINPELTPDEPEHMPEAALHYDPQTVEHVVESFAPVIIEYYPDDKPKKGLCGRDRQGNYTLPEGLDRRDYLFPLTTSADWSEPLFGAIHDLLINEAPSTRHQANWHIFENPTAEEQADHDLWNEI